MTVRSDRAYSNGLVVQHSDDADRSKLQLPSPEVFSRGFGTRRRRQREKNADRLETFSLQRSQLAGLNPNLWAQSSKVLEQNHKIVSAKEGEGVGREVTGRPRSGAW